jgi:hypothetical protein
MTHSAPGSCIQIDHAHVVAISEEIGEGLRTRSSPEQLPPRLVRLVAQLREDRAANAARRIA